MSIGNLFDLLVLLTLTLWLLGLGAQGRMSGETIVLVLLGLTFLLAVSRRAKVGLARTTFRIGIPLTALATFVIVYGGGDLRRMAPLLGSVVALVVMLFGFYIMFGGLSRRGRR